MSQVCSKCQRINPGDAIYCYWDGALLQGHSGNGPVNPGVLPFPSPFVFPSGQSCQNFDQLAMACQNNWGDAIDLLRKGFLGGFFGGLGRADLAMAAQEAAQYPDQDRGLDLLLGKLPSRALEEPRLKIEPAEVNLGTVPMGADRHFEIRLGNQGMRLVFGSIASDSKWLTIGEAPGQNQKIFQFRDEIVMPVQIRGKELRAGPKALEGHLFVDSNGSKKQLQVKVLLEVPVKLFPDGVLAGAATPRQIAEKAKASPKEAAALFENGAVARWFTENGWIYPVQGPSASGLGAVQQFFEALGLAKAPKVIIDKQAVVLQGAPNQTVQTTLEVRTEEKRPVYAHASANVPWVEVGHVRLSGRSATITVRVPSVPYTPGQTLQARIRVAANGNQRFDIPLSLNVLAGSGTAWAIPQAVPAAMAAQPVFAMPIEPVMVMPAEAAPIEATPIMPVEVSPIQAMPVPPPVQSYMAAPAPNYPAPHVQAYPAAPVNNPPIQAYAVPPASPVPAAPIIGAAPAYQADPFAGFAAGSAPAAPLVTPSYHAAGRRQATSPFLHLLPLLLLILLLGGTVIKDLLLAHKATPSTQIEILTGPQIGVGFDYDKFYSPPNGGKSMRFGVWKPTNDPKHPVMLTFNSQGLSNSTMLKIDGKVMEFGDQTDGWWASSPTKEHGKHGGALAGWGWPAGATKVKVTQEVEKIPGDPFIDNGTLKRAIDTCLVRYTIENVDKQNSHLVGIRVLWDTLIGDNDGVPFTVAGNSNLVDEVADFKTPESVPDFVQALERPNLDNPGVVVRLKLRNPDMEAAERVSLTLWPGAGKEDKLLINKLMHEWEIPIASFKPLKDSAVVMYWNEKPLKPGEKRVVGFTYGLVHLAKGTGDISATYNGELAKGKKITVTALITQPEPGETLTLKLPEGLKLADGSAKLEQSVPVPVGALQTNPNPIQWNIIPESTGNFRVTITSNKKNRSVTLELSVTASGIFGG